MNKKEVAKKMPLKKISLDDAANRGFFKDNSREGKKDWASEKRMQKASDERWERSQASKKRGQEAGYK